MNPFRLSTAAALAALLSLNASSAFAGKPERDRADELKPQFESTARDVKTACGCEVPVTTSFESFPSVDDMIRIPDTLDGFKAASTKYCEKPADKEAFCKNISGMKVMFNKELDTVKLDGKTILAPTGSTQYTSEDIFLGIMNKF
jgi:hypothetical protein